MLAAIAFLMRCGNIKLAILPNIDADSNNNRETDIDINSDDATDNDIGSNSYSGSENSNKSNDRNSDNNDSNVNTGTGAIITFKNEANQRDDNDKININLTAGDDNASGAANVGQEGNEENAEKIDGTGHDSAGNNENLLENNEDNTIAYCTVNHNANAEDNTSVDNVESEIYVKKAVNYTGVQSDDAVGGEKDNNRNGSESNSNEETSNESNFKESGGNESNENDNNFDNKCNAGGSRKTVNKDNDSKQGGIKNKQTDSKNINEEIEEADRHSSSNDPKSKGKRRYNDHKQENKDCKKESNNPKIKYNDEEHKKHLQEGYYGLDTENRKSSSNNPNSSSSQQSKQKDSPNSLKFLSSSDSLDNILLPPTIFSKPPNAASPSGTYVSTIGTMSTSSYSSTFTSYPKNRQDASSKVFRILHLRSSGGSSSRSKSKSKYKEKAKIIISPGLAATLVTQNVQFLDNSKSQHISFSSLADSRTVSPSSADTSPKIRPISLLVESPTDAKLETSDKSMSST
ncbi:hypothetical protein INT46_004516 [Mucor plumbeus]|uniref:Uncharacterized protein n=1 Tax=Mucor plumbeus TaxID=97098 RepID=A0A8H7RIP8_9FUNG|nr:hypothetical protein INT46_004516 [Mucor plumbeus]